MFVRERRAQQMLGPGRSTAGLTLGFAAERFDGVFDQRRQLAGHQDKVGVKALSEVIAIDIVILLAQLSANFRRLSEPSSDSIS